MSGWLSALPGALRRSWVLALLLVAAVAAAWAWSRARAAGAEPGGERAPRAAQGPLTDRYRCPISETTRQPMTAASLDATTEASPSS